MKSIFASKVFWLAVIQAVAGVVVVFQSSFPNLGWLIVVKSIADILLRMYTTQPVTLVRD